MENKWISTKDREKIEKHLYSLISFNKKEIRKFKKGDNKRKMQHYLSLEILYDLKRQLLV